MIHTMPDMQIRIHKVDGTDIAFVQNDPGEVKKILDSFQPARIFDQNRFTITDGDSITLLPVSKITRIDLLAELPAHLVFPLGIVDAVELNGAEFETLVRNPVMREQWEQMRTQEDSLVTFLDLELADGERLFLTQEMHIDLQSEALRNSGWFPLEGSSLCFRMRSGCVAVLNLANLVRLTFFPKPVHALSGAWHARQCTKPMAAKIFGHPSPVAFVPTSKPPALQTKKYTERK
jgi:hypothetical protein